MTSTSYPITWQERRAAPLEGRLEVCSGEIAFEGIDVHGRPVWRTIPLHELRALRFFLDDEADTTRALLLETTTGQVAIRSVARHAQLLEELANRIVDRELAEERDLCDRTPSLNRIGLGW